MDSNSSNATLAIATLVVGAVIGGIAGFAISDSKKNDGSSGNQAPLSSQASEQATKAADLRVALNNLAVSHVDLVAAATRAGFDGDPSAKAAADAVGENTDELSAAVADVYGDEAGTQFKEAWSDHVDYLTEYTAAAKAGDQADMDKAVQKLDGYVESISAFFGEATQGDLSKESAAQLISEHITLQKEVIDKHAAGDYAGSYDAQERARTQITNKIADTLADAIVKQSPEKY